MAEIFVLTLYFNIVSISISKSELITTFLAMLELIKIKRITVYQTSIFSPIYLKINDEIKSSDNDIIVDNTET